MNTLQRKSIVLAVFGAIALAGCGAGTSSPGASAGPSLARTGVITGFGSVFVNGVEYETDNSSVTLDDNSGSEGDLKVGMVVTLEGSVNDDGVTGTATSISYADELEGIVSAVNIATDGTGTLTVMGQTVTIDAATVFESDVGSVTSFSTIVAGVAGNIVEVSGYSAGNGSIFATRVEVKKAALGAGDEIELKGVIASLDAAAQTFMLGTLMVHYGSAQVERSPANGLYVEVKSTTAPTIDNMLTATKVEVEGDGDKGMDGDVGDEVEIEGMVTSALVDDEFVLNGQTVLVNDNTEFKHGASGDIILGAKLEVEGTLDAAGRLVADEIKFRSASDIEIEALLEAVDITASTITLLGQTIKVNTLTVKVDERDENGLTPEHFFDLTDLDTRQRIEVKAYVDNTGALVATMLKRDDGTSSIAKLEGPITSVTSTQAVVAGVTIELSGLGLTPTVGDELHVEGTFASGLLTASSAEIDS